MRLGGRIWILVKFDMLFLFFGIFLVCGLGIKYVLYIFLVVVGIGEWS